MSERPTNWKDQPETQLFTLDGYKTTKKGKKKPIYNLYDPADPNVSVQGVKAPTSTAPGNMAPSPGLGSGSLYDSTPKGVRPQSSGISSTFDTNYGSGINAYTGRAPGGSLASNVADSQLTLIGSDPYQITNAYMMNRGLQSDSDIAALASNLYNPVAKSLGIMGGQGFSSDVDAINFGQQLLDQFTSGSGEQLNGLKMVETALVAIADAKRNPLGSEGMPSQLAAIAAQANPSDQLESILGVMEGILMGTMPEMSAKALLTQMRAAGQAFISGKIFDTDPVGSEKAGKNLANQLLSWFQAKF